MIKQTEPVALVVEARSDLLFGQSLTTVLLYGVLLLLALTTLTPLFWMLTTSLKTADQAFQFPPQWIPIPPQWDNYVQAWDAEPFGLFYFNSFKIAVLVIAGRLFFSSLAGYGFARFDFPLKNQMFAMLLAVMLVPGTVTVVPLFEIYKFLGWYNTHWALIVAPATAQTFGTFLMRQFMLTVPSELEEAAYIDGASAFAIYWHIMLPLCRPALAVLAIFTFTETWNSFFDPLIFLESKNLFTVTLGLSYFQTDYGTDWNLLMAGSTMALVPLVIFFLFTQRYFTGGIALGGLKG